jgi:NADP-dependent 3-hydroxy acid dehydrogenase YdfG
MENNIKGKVVVITGASSGLGEAAAKHLSTLGATVVLGARRAGRIEKLAKEIQDNGGKALAVAIDVTQRDQVKGLVDAAVEQFGRVDVILNNAGIMPLSPMDRLNVDEWDGMINVNINNIRTTIVCPGAVKTELLEQITEADIQQANKDYVGSVGPSPDSFAHVVAFAISQPEDVDINEIVFRPTSQEL